MPSNPRMLNGSSLRHEQKPSPKVPDPLTILRSILGIVNVETTHGRKSSDQTEFGKPAKLRADIDFGSLSLEDYADQEPVKSPAQVGATPHKDDSPQLSFFDEREKYKELHGAIENCDQVLNSVESYLTNFQYELGAVSAEIESLQNRSTQLNAKLDNRTRVEKLLGPAVEDISISPSTVRTISEGPVDDNWVAALRDLENRSASIDRKSDEPVKALEDVQPLLRDLKAKAIERIRDFIVAQIKALRSPSINAQIIQQKSFIKYKELYHFLTKHSPVLADEIGQAYVNTMKWYYSSNFVRYQQALDKLHIHVIEPTEVVGAEPTPAKRNVLSSTKSSPPQHDAFSLGRRSDILKTHISSAITSYTAEEDKTYHYLETTFNNFNLALIDNVCFEYTILTDLFSTKPFTYISRKVNEIFEPTFSTGLALTKSLIDTNTDCLGTLICVRLNQHLAFQLQRRKVPVADGYINRTAMLLWPRFQIIMDLHCDSLRRATPSSSDTSSPSPFSTSNASKTSLAPHPLTQRFGQFLHAILFLSSKASDDEPVSASVLRLRTEYEACMGRLARAAGVGAGDTVKRNRFLYYNYSLVLTIIGDTEGRLAGEHRGYFEELIKLGGAGRGGGATGRERR